MPSTTDLALKLNFAKSTAVLWCDAFDLYATEPISRVGAKRVRKISDRQLELIFLCHRAYSNNPIAGTIGTQICSTLGQERFLKADLQKVFDAEMKTRENSKAPIQSKPSSQIQVPSQAVQPSVSRSRGTVTEISRSQSGSESQQLFRNLFQEFQEHSSKQAAGFQQTMIGVLEKFHTLIIGAEESPKPRANQELVEFKEEVKLVELAFRKKVLLNEKAKFERRNTPFGQWLDFVAYRALQFFVIGVVVVFAIGVPVFLYFLIAVLSRGQ